MCVEEAASTSRSLQKADSHTAASSPRERRSEGAAGEASLVWDTRSSRAGAEAGTPSLHTVKSQTTSGLGKGLILTAKFERT